jgi:hypothetical protein
VSRTHTADGRRRSAMTHASRSHTCGLCGRVGWGNGAEAAHGRAHVRRGEAVELVKVHGFPMAPSRLFVAPEDPRVEELLARGFERVAG